MTIYGPQPTLSAGWVSLMGQEVKIGLNIRSLKFLQNAERCIFLTFSIEIYFLKMDANHVLKWLFIIRVI